MQSENKSIAEKDFSQKSKAKTAEERSIGRLKLIFNLTLMLAVLAAGIGTYFDSRVEASDNPQKKALKPQAPAVEVVTLKEEQVRHWVEFSGRLQAVDFVKVRPRVGGTIQQVFFKDGETVDAGAPLFVIDPRPFEAAVAKAKAQLESAKSERQFAEAELARNRQLIKKKVISESRYDSSNNAYKVTLAAVNEAEAALKQARLDLEYAHITAPVSGRISRAEITEGNVIEAGPNAPVLTTIVSNDTLYAEFDVDEQTYVKTVRQMAGGAPPVELVLPGDQEVVYRGVLHSFDNRLDTSSGTIRARALFENRDGALLAGMYAKVRLSAASKEFVLMVPERAIGTNQDQKFVYAINQNHEVNYRVVQPGRSVGIQRVILSGLEPGEQVIVNGLHRVRPKMLVQPVEKAQQAQASNAVTKLTVKG